MSANGRLAPRPATASWNAVSTSSSERASTIVPPWTSGSKPGLAVNSGSRSTATLTLTVPDRVFHRSMSATKSAGNSSRSSRRRNEIFGWAVVTTIGAVSCSPPARATPVTAPPAVVMRSTAAIGADLGAERPGGRRHRRSQPAHPARGEPPRPRVRRGRRRRSGGGPSRTRCPATAARPTFRSPRTPTARLGAGATRSSPRAGRRRSSRTAG